MDPLDQYDFLDTDFMDEHSDKFSKIIGEYIIDFSYLEHSLDKLISEMMDDRSDAVGFIIMSEMGMSNKIDLLEKFIKLEKYHGLKRPKHIAPLIRELRAVNTFRNRLAHANWSSMRQDGMTRIKTRIDKNNGIYFENFKLDTATIINARIVLGNLVSKIEDLELEI
jgi:hypothetical protein